MGESSAMMLNHRAIKQRMDLDRRGRNFVAFAPISVNFGEPSPSKRDRSAIARGSPEDFQGVSDLLTADEGRERASRVERGALTRVNARGARADRRVHRRSADPRGSKNAIEANALWRGR